LTSGDKKEEIPAKWIPVTPPVATLSSSLQSALDAMTSELLTIPIPPGTFDSKKAEKTTPEDNAPFEAILIHPGDSTSAAQGLLLYPHGGPHSITPTAYTTEVVFYVSLGFDVVIVNYRGSTGFGERALASLASRCGEQDVADCMSALRAAQELLTSRGICPPSSRLAVAGGSHGGFLVGHLIGQYPSLFRAAITRNPALNIAAQLFTTDIPDWCYTESGAGPFQDDFLVEGSHIEKMFSVSPISHISKVVTPLLLALGEVDKRVPMCSGIEYFRALQARGIPSRCLVYPKANHGLRESVKQEGDCLVNMAIWLLTHLQIESLPF